MRILFWTGFFPPNIGGIEVFSAQLVTALKDRGHDLCILTSHSGQQLPDKMDYYGISVYRFQFYNSLLNNDLKAMKHIQIAVKQLKQEFQPEIIHLNIFASEPSLFYQQHTQSASNSKIILTIHALPILNANKSPLYSRSLSSMDYVTTVSRAMRTGLLKTFRNMKKEIHVIHNGLALPQIKCIQPTYNPPNIITIGRVCKEKGFDIALKAFAIVQKTFPAAKLTIAGDGPELTNLRNLTNELGINNQVNFLGWVEPDQVPELLNTASIVLMPSRWKEPFGLVALQASQMAKPVVATSVGGIPEIIEHEKTGLLVENEDYSQMAEGIITLISNPEWAINLGLAGRKRAETKFSITNMTDKYEELYKF
ncbi:glycosyltransferase family 4 protein [Candidatus Neomarinimicrobiota bacterium]